MNIFSIITVAIMIIMTSYTVFLVHRHKNIFTTPSGMTISLAVASMAGLLSGFILGIYSGDMFLSGGVSVIIGFIIGFLAGQPLGIMAMLNGAIPGLLSGLMGSFLGVLLQFTSPLIMLGILLALYVVIMALIILFIKVESDEKLSLDTQTISPFAILAAGVVLITLFLFLFSSDFVKIPGEDTNTAKASETASSQSQTAVQVDVSKESAPKILMKVTDAGYTPNVIRVKKGAAVELVIDNPLEDSCLSTFTMSDFNINNVNLKVGTTTLSFTPDKTGKYTFSCGMQMFKGSVIVVD